SAARLRIDQHLDWQTSAIVPLAAASQRHINVTEPGTRGGIVRLGRLLHGLRRSVTIRATIRVDDEVIRPPDRRLVRRQRLNLCDGESLRYPTLGTQDEDVCSLTHVSDALPSVLLKRAKRSVSVPRGGSHCPVTSLPRHPVQER